MSYLAGFSSLQPFPALLFASRAPQQQRAATVGAAPEARRRAPRRQEQQRLARNVQVSQEAGPDACVLAFLSVA
jgi:hypothetical protein